MRLSEKQRDVLAILQEGTRPMRPREIGEAALARGVSWVGTDDQGITAACDRLCEKGLAFNRAGTNIVLFFADEIHDERAVQEITEYLLEQRSNTQRRQRRNTPSAKAYRRARREDQANEQAARQAWLAERRRQGRPVSWLERVEWERSFRREREEKRDAERRVRQAARDRRRRQRLADEQRRRADRERRRRTRIARNSIANPVRLDAPIGGNPDLRLGDVVPGQSPDPMATIMADQLHDLVGDKSIEHMNEMDLMRLRRDLLKAGFSPPSVQQSERDRLRIPMPHRGRRAA